MKWFWWLIAGLFLLNLVKNLWNNRYLKGGWVIPSVGIVLWSGAFWLYENDSIPLWIFAVTAIFCEPIGGPLGSFLLMIRFGGKRRFVAWRLFQLTEDKFDKLKRACRTAKNQEAAQKIFKQELALRFLDRYNSPFCREFFKPLEKDMAQVHDYLKIGLVEAKTYLEVDRKVNAIHSELQKLSEMARMARLYS